MLHATATGTAPALSNMAVGLISVDQLSLDARFSDIRGITEVYNLLILGNPNDHLFIVGND